MESTNRHRFDAARFRDVLARVDAGAPVALACANLGVSQATFYRWKRRFRSDLRDVRVRVLELETRNAALAALLERRERELEALRAVLRRKR